MLNRCCTVACAALLALPLTGSAGGGWAVVTVESLPDVLAVGGPTDFAIRVRQHGQQKVTQLAPAISAHAGERGVRGEYIRDGDAERYVLRITIPEPGEWTITFGQVYGSQHVSLLPMQAVRPGAQPVAAITDAERGRRLFVAKGCAGCHTHRGIPELHDDGYPQGMMPDLTNTALAPAFLRAFIADPAMRPRTNQYIVMPKLELTPAEIESIVAFLAPPERKVTHGTSR